MKKKGFVLVFIFFVILIAAALYFGYDYYAKFPSDTTKNTAKNFLKYPNAKGWLQIDKRTLCIYYFDGCTQTPSIINFTTQDAWSNIYAYYRNSLEGFGWTTHTKVITSIPGEINFSGDFENAFCDAQLQKPKGVETSYMISITCYPR